MTPIVDGLETEFMGQIQVERLDAVMPANANLMTEYGVRGHPAFVVIDADGRVRQTFVGPQTEATLHAAITAVAPP